MKAVILAGGLGTRLGKYTKDIPKCMLNFKGKSLLERQVETLKSCGINKIIITRKHLADKINLPGVCYDDKAEEDGGNMVADFFHAQKEFDEDILLCYGDIIYEPRILKKVLECPRDICVVADSEWKEYWIARLGSWKEDSESFIIGENNKIISLGKENPPKEEMHARYVGLIKFSKKILPKVTELYNLLEKEYKGNENAWRNSSSFKQACMTDFLQELIERGFNVYATEINRGWMEFDTEKDYEQILDWAKTGELKEFINLD